MTPPIERKIKELVAETTIVGIPNNLIAKALDSTLPLVNCYKERGLLTDEEAERLTKDIKFRQSHLPLIRLCP